MTTYAAFLAALAGLVVTGVNRRYSAPPTQLSTADLPVSYPRVPSGEERPMTADGQGGWATLAGELVVVLEPMGQSRAQSNFAATVAMIDSLSVALRGVQLTKSKHNWSVRREGVSLGQDGVDYWALVATVTGNG